MRQFKELIEEIEIDGVKFIPIVELAKLATSRLMKEMTITKIREIEKSGKLQKCCVTLNHLSYGDFSFSLNSDYSAVCLYHIDNEEIISKCELLQIFQKLYQWGFVDMPKPAMPSDEAVETWWATKRFIPMDSFDRTIINEVKQALQHFMGSK